MPTEGAEYTIADLARLTGVTARTVRYYVAQGLVPPPGETGRGARYGDAHLARLRLVRRLQRQHLPLAEIRARLAALDDAAVATLVAEAELAPEPAEPQGSALDYIRGLLGEASEPTTARAMAVPLRPMPAPSRPLMAMESWAPYDSPEPDALATGPAPKPALLEERSQWDRISLGQNVELHIRRPLSREERRRVERLITIARQLMEEGSR